MLESYNITENLDEEEKKLVNNLDSKSKNILILNHMWQVKPIASKFASSYEDINDLISVGTIGLIKGVANLTPNKNTKISTYLYSYIRGEILKYLRGRKKIQKEISFNNKMNDSDDSEFEEILYIDSNPFEGIEIKKDLKDAIKKLNTKEKTVIQLRYFFGDKVLSQRKVATIIGTSQTIVSEIERKALKKLRNTLVEYF